MSSVASLGGRPAPGVTILARPECHPVKHQAFSCFERDLLLLQISFNLSALGLKSVISRLKKKPYL